MSVPEEDIDVPSTTKGSPRFGRLAAFAAYLMLGTLLVLVVRPANVTSYNIGQSAAVAVMAILISYGIWSLIRRSRGSGERWSPWILMIALFVATLLKALPQDDTQPPDAAATASIATLTSDDVFVEVPGLRYEPVPADTLEQAEDDLFADPSIAGAFLGMDGRLVFEGRRQVGIVTVVFSTAEAGGR